MICPNCCVENLNGNETCRNCVHDLTHADRPFPGSAIERSLMEERVYTLKEFPPVTAGPETTVQEAIGLMIERNVGAILVVDGDGKLLGIFTERDLLKRVACVPDYAGLPIQQFMTARPEAVATTATLNFVLQKMDAGGYRHIPVQKDGRPVSILSVRAMLRHIVGLCKDS